MKKLAIIITIVSMLTITACYPFIKDVTDQSILADTHTIEISD